MLETSIKTGPSYHSPLTDPVTTQELFSKKSIFLNFFGKEIGSFLIICLDKTREIGYKAALIIIERSATHMNFSYQTWQALYYYFYFWGRGMPMS